VVAASRTGTSTHSKRGWGGTECGEFSFELGTAAAQLSGVGGGRFVGHRGDPFLERSQIDRRQAGRGDPPLPGLRGRRGVEGDSGADSHPLQQAQPAGGPHPRRTHGEGGQRPFHLGGLVFLGVQPDPFIDRGNITGPGHPQGDEDLGLGEDVFVEHGGSLGDQGDADPAGAAASDEVFDRAEQALPDNTSAA